MSHTVSNSSVGPCCPAVARLEQTAHGSAMSNEAWGRLRTCIVGWAAVGVTLVVQLVDEELGVAEVLWLPIEAEAVHTAIVTHAELARQMREVGVEDVKHRPASIT